MKNYLFFILLILFSLSGVAQPCSSWLKTLKEENNLSSVSGASMEVDQAGNTIIAGIVKGTITLEEEPFSETAGLGNGFVAQFDVEGKLNWLEIFAGPRNWLIDIAIDSLDNIVVLGHYEGTMTIQNTVLTPFPGQGGGGYLAKFNQDGTLQWLKDIQSANGYYLKDVETDTAGNILVIEDYSPTLKKFDPNGTLLWKKVFTSYSPDYNKIAVADNNEIFVTGNFSLSMGSFVTFDTFSFSGLQTGYSIAFIGKMSPEGDFIWVKLLDSDKPVYALAMDIDKDGNPYIGGRVQGTFVFNGNMIQGDWKEKAYVAKYNGNGEEDWIKLGICPDGGVCDCRSLKVNENGSVFVGGRIEDPDGFSFGGVSGEFDNGIFLVKMDTVGVVQWIKGYQKSTTVNEADDICCISADQNENCYFLINTDIGGVLFDSRCLEKVAVFFGKIDSGGILFDTSFFKLGQVVAIGCGAEKTPMISSGQCFLGYDNYKVSWTPSGLLENDTIVRTFYLGTPTNSDTTLFTIEIEADNGCKILDSLKLYYDAEPYLVVEGDTTVEACTYVQIKTMSNMGLPYTYKWTPLDQLNISQDVRNPVALPTSSVTYYCTLENATCGPITDSVSITVTNPAFCYIEFDNGYLKAVHNLDGGDYYIWERNGTAILGGYEQQIMPTSTGVYGVRVYSGYCNVGSPPFDYNPNHTADESQGQEFSIYPNPVDGKKGFNVMVHYSDFYSAEIQLLNSYGQELSRQIIPNGVSNLSFEEELTPGIYFVKIYFDEEQLVSKRLIVK